MQKLITSVFIAIIFCSCGDMLKKDVRRFIDGSYVRRFESDFVVGTDSVVLQHQDGDHYSITKYSRFSRVKNGTHGREEFLEEKMAGKYDPQTEQINELKKGKVLHFDPEKNRMMIGAAEYGKVK